MAPKIADIEQLRIGISVNYFLPKSAPPPVLYSGHKESGLVRISLSIGLGGPGWARGLYMDRKKQRGPARPPCLK
jgi:hypothetical protein